MENLFPTFLMKLSWDLFIFSSILSIYLIRAKNNLFILLCVLKDLFIPYIVFCLLFVHAVLNFFYDFAWKFRLRGGYYQHKWYFFPKVPWKFSLCRPFFSPLTPNIRIFSYYIIILKILTPGNLNWLNILFYFCPIIQVIKIILFFV